MLSLQGDGPSRNSHGWNAIYFVLFVCIGSYLVLNLFISAVVDTFESERDKATGIVMLTEAQEKFVLAMQSLLQTQPEPPPSPPPKGERQWDKFR